MITYLLRFSFGAILMGSVVIWTGPDFPLDVLLVLSVAIMATVWGDKFILGFMSLMRYFR